MECYNTTANQHPKALYDASLALKTYPCPSLLFLPRLIPHPMTDPQILLKQILREIIEFLILSSQPICSSYPAHTRHLMHIHQRPGSSEEGAVLAIQEHHAGYDAHVVLPSVAQLMPPFRLDDFGFVNVVYGP